ncbi:MAG: hypothetical protein DMF68_03145 [Acidobacteria bacterium]|nr:MAG: hypothetical protein DMF68_03145 [Acidobacteriota bacterium]
MRVIYATGQPRYLNFAVVDRREDVPAGATLFAICTTSRTMENMDEDLFDAITDEEYYTFRQLVTEAEQLERTQARPQQSTIRLSLKRFFSWLRAGGKEAARFTISGEHRMP